MFKFIRFKFLIKYMANRWVLMSLVGLGLFQYAGRSAVALSENQQQDTVVVVNESIFCRNHAWTGRVFVQLYAGEEVRICMTHQDTNKASLNMRFRIYKCGEDWEYASDRKNRFYGCSKPDQPKPIKEFEYHNLNKCCTSMKITEQAIYEIELIPTTILQFSYVDFLITVNGFNSVQKNHEVEMKKFIDTTWENITFTERWGDTSYCRISTYAFELNEQEERIFHRDFPDSIRAMLVTGISNISSLPDSFRIKMNEEKKYVSVFFPYYRKGASIDSKRRSADFYVQFATDSLHNQYETNGSRVRNYIDTYYRSTLLSPTKKEIHVSVKNTGLKKITILLLFEGQLVKNIQEKTTTKPHASYFSYHKPILKTQK